MTRRWVNYDSVWFLAGSKACSNRPQFPPWGKCEIPLTLSISLLDTSGLLKNNCCNTSWSTSGDPAWEKAWGHCSASPTRVVNSVVKDLILRGVTGLDCHWLVLDFGNHWVSVSAFATEQNPKLNRNRFSLIDEFTERALLECLCVRWWGGDDTSLICPGLEYFFVGYKLHCVTHRFVIVQGHPLRLGKSLTIATLQCSAQSIFDRSPSQFWGFLLSFLAPWRPNQCPGGKVGYPPLASELQMSPGGFHEPQLCWPAGFCTLSLLLPEDMTQIASPREYWNTPQTNDPNLSRASKEWRCKNDSGFF